MTELVPDIEAVTFDAQRALTVQVLTEKDPTLDLTPGAALDGLLVENEAHLAALQAQQLEQARLASSLQAIVDGKVTVTDAEVDLLVSNYFITRRPAQRASGPVRVIVSVAVSFQIPRGFAFTVDNLIFRTTEVIRVYQTNATDFVETSSARRIYGRPDGKYEFTLSVLADQDDPAGRLAAGTTLLISAPLAGMETAVAATDFVGGQPAETNEELLARVQPGITAKTLGGEDHVRAALSTEFPGIVVRCLGVGSALMKRDRANLLGVSTGGKMDVWFRVSGYPSVRTLTLPALVLSATQRRLSFVIDSTQAAGLYRVLAIRPAGAAMTGGDVPESVLRGVVRDTGYSPAYPTASDVTFTAHQQLNVQFIDTLTTTPLVDGETRSYEVDVSYMPSTQAVTSYTLDAGRRPLGVDVAVRAAAPCLLSGSMAVRYRAGSVAPSVSSLRRAVADAVAALPLGTTSLPSYLVHRAVAPLLGNDAVVTSVVLRGVVNCPVEGEINLALPSSQDVVIPERPDLGIGPDNVFFALSPEGLEVSLAAQ